jgi:hypothetical protein
MQRPTVRVVRCTKCKAKPSLGVHLVRQKAGPARRHPDPFRAFWRGGIHVQLDQPATDYTLAPSSASIFSCLAMADGPIPSPFSRRTLSGSIDAGRPLYTPVAFAFAMPSS